MLTTICIQCGNSLVVNTKICDQCGAVVMPETNVDDEDIKEYSEDGVQPLSEVFECATPERQPSRSFELTIADEYSRTSDASEPVMHKRVDRMQFNNESLGVD